MTNKENVRVLHGSETPDISYMERRQRTPGQKHRDTILDEAEEKFTEARDLWAEGEDVFAVVQEPQHRNLQTLMGQVIEQLVEYRRTKG